MKILITGTSGFIGVHALRELYDNKSEIIILSSTMRECKEKVIYALDYIFDDDYLRKSGCDDVETIIHLGAFTPKSSRDVNDITGAYSNIRSTERLLSSKLPKLKRIIYISTLDVYGDVEGVISENTLPHPYTMYGWSKLYCEEMVKSYCEINDIVYCILRLGHVCGEGEEKYKKVLPIMIQSAITNRDLVIYGSGEVYRNFIYVKDVAKIIAKSVTVCKSDIINVVGDENITINRIAERVIQLSDSKSRILHQEYNGVDRSLRFENTKLRKLFPIELTSFDNALRHEIHYMKNRCRYEYHI